MLADHPEIRVVLRDRGGGYGEASAKALPDTIQVADHWHLMENTSAAFLDAVRKSMRAIRSAIDTADALVIAAIEAGLPSLVEARSSSTSSTI